MGVGRNTAHDSEDKKLKSKLPFYVNGKIIIGYETLVTTRISTMNNNHNNNNHNHRMIFTSVMNDWKTKINGYLYFEKKRKTHDNTYVCMHARIHVCIYAYMHECMCACMHVCMQTSLSSFVATISVGWQGG